MNTVFREINSSDIEKVKNFILLHGPNQWNYLPVAWLEKHLELVASGRVYSIMGLHEEEIVGVATFYVGSGLIFT